MSDAKPAAAERHIGPLAVFILFAAGLVYSLLFPINRIATENGVPALGYVVWISLGGGAITQGRNWHVIRATGVCLCFRASVETIFERVERKRDERPLLAGLDDAGLRAKIETMLEERAQFYERADAFVISTEDRTPEEVAELALAELRKVLV